MFNSVMKQIIFVIAILAVGYYAYTKYSGNQKGAVEAPPPPPPVIELPPPHVLSDPELQRVQASTKDSDPHVRWEALQLLVTSQDPRAEEIMFQMLHHDSEADIRKNIIGVLGERKGPRVSENLVEMLKDMEPEVRLAALQSLARVGDPSTAPAISEALRDSDERVRLSALTTLKNMQDQRNREIEEKRRLQEELVRQREQALRQQAEKNK